MLRTNSSRALIARLIASSLLFLFALAYTATIRAQATPFPGSTAVGSSSSAVTVSVALPAGGTIAAVKLLGQGSPNIDFVSSGGTCAAGATLLPLQSCTLSVVFTPGSAGPRRGAVVLLDQSGKAIGTQLLSAQATGSVGVFTPGLISTVAGDSTWVYDGDGGPANQSPIFLPFGVAVDGAGDLFIADSNNNRIRRVDAKTGNISTLAGNGVVGSSGDGGPALQASLSSPSSVTLDPAGNVYFADSGNSVIRRVDAFTGTITTVAGQQGLHGYTGDQGQGTHATFNIPNGIAFDAAGNLYIADTGNHAIRMLAVSGIITTVAGTGTAGFSGDGGPATKAAINAPWSATPANGGGFYIADQNNSRIRFVAANGVITTFAGTTAGFSG